MDPWTEGIREKSEGPINQWQLHRKGLLGNENRKQVGEREGTELWGKDGEGTSSAGGKKSKRG